MPSLRQIRLTSGLVLYVYATLHFANHALGNISVGAMETGLAVQKLIWQSPPGAVILYASLLTHMSLGFWALYERRRFRWTRLEATQLVLGLSIPFLLTNHVIGTRVALSQFGLEKGYAQELVNFWVGSPAASACWKRASSTASRTRMCAAAADAVRLAVSASSAT
jgi:adenylate cyclase